jgi:hypothetical protein
VPNPIPCGIFDTGAAMPDSWIKTLSKVVLAAGVFVGGIVGGAIATQSNVSTSEAAEWRTPLGHMEGRQDKLEQHLYRFEERIEMKIDRMDRKIDELRGK